MLVILVQDVRLQDVDCGPEPTVGGMTSIAAVHVAVEAAHKPDVVRISRTRAF